MHIRILPILLLLLTLRALAQTTDLAPLRFNNPIRSLYITPKGQAIITCVTGTVAISDRADRPFHVSIPDHLDKKITPLDFGLQKGVLFNKDTGFIIVNINGAPQVIYHTKNGGKSWQEISIGPYENFTGACALPKGEAWIACKDVLLYSKDYGQTWIPRKKFAVSKYTGRIFFNHKHQGLISSNGPSLEYTPDNGLTWRKIPTPNDGRIMQLAMYKDSLLLMQEWKVYRTHKDRIKWEHLYQYTDFITDPQNTALLFNDTKRQWVKSGEGPIPLQNFDPSSVAISNGQIYFMNADCRLLVYTRKHQLQFHDLHTTEKVTPQPAVIVNAPIGTYYGYLGNKIYNGSYYTSMQYLCTLPFDIPNPNYLYIQPPVLSYITPNDTAYQYDMSTSSPRQVHVTKLTIPFLDHPVRTITFTASYTSCYGKGRNEIAYSYGNHNFTSKDTTAIIPEQPVNDFVYDLCSNFHKTAVLQELDLHDSDYVKLREKIINSNDPDKGIYLSAVDSIQQIDSSTLTQILKSEMVLNEKNTYAYSWTGVKFTNEAGVSLELRKYFNGRLNGLNIQWVIVMGEYSFVSYSPHLKTFFQAYCPQLLRHDDKTNFLEELAHLYYN